MTGWVGGLVKVDNTRADVGLQVTLERRGTGRDWGEVAGSDHHCAATWLAMFEDRRHGEIFFGTYTSHNS